MVNNIYLELNTYNKRCSKVLKLFCINNNLNYYTIYILYYIYKKFKDRI